METTDVEVMKKVMEGVAEEMKITTVTNGVFGQAIAVGDTASVAHLGEYGELQERSAKLEEHRAEMVREYADKVIAWYKASAAKHRQAARDRHQEVEEEEKKWNDFITPKEKPNGDGLASNQK